MRALLGHMIASIPEDWHVDDVIVGVKWTAVRCGDRVGLARTCDDGRFPLDPLPRCGMPLGELAGGLFSWCSLAAGLGLAALNAAYNTAEYLGGGDLTWTREDVRRLNLRLRRETADRRCALVEYPLALDDPALAGSIPSLLRREPEDGDYPLAAAAELLPRQELVFLSGRTVAEKSLPRLLALAAGSRIILADWDMPAALAAGRREEMITFLVTEPDRCMALVRIGAGEGELIHTGQFVRIGGET